MGMGFLLLTGVLLTAQPATGEVVAMNDRGFNIPVGFDEKQRPLIREVILFESADQGRQWNQRAVNSPTKKEFAVNVPSDGSYWYALCVVDQNGQRQPSDPSKSARIMKVLVDTKRPEVRITAARQGEGIIAEWSIQEENPKLGTFKLEYRTAEMPAGQWTVVDTKPQLSGRVGFPVSGSSALTVRLTLTDEADNVGTSQVEITGAAPPIGIPIPTTLPGPGPAAESGSGSPFSAHPVGMVRDSAFAKPSTLEPAPPSPAPSSASAAGASGAIAATGPQSPPLGPPAGPAPSPPGSRGQVAGLEYVNTNRVTLKYTVDKVGASGLGSVDLYVTRDDGGTWQRLTGEQLTTAGLADPGGIPPTERSLTAELPGEGRYGFYLIVRSGVGLGKQPPRNGDRPQMRVEVDLTPPEGTLYGLQPVPGQTNAVVVRWKASDLNLSEKPIRLEWAERKGGPWTPIGEGDLPNTGYHTWKLPANIPGKVYLKMTITDLARNTGVAESPEPVTIDLSEPEARIIGLGVSR